LTFITAAAGADRGRECLEMLGCYGPGRSKLAEIYAAVGLGEMPRAGAVIAT